MGRQLLSGVSGLAPGGVQVLAGGGQGPLKNRLAVNVP
jgi:hypothetical protein